MEIYKDMLEKLKYHKQLLMNAFIKNNYYPSIEEINASLESIDSRLSLFETYISKPGSCLNTTELNYCFEMIYKDIEILYKVMQEILTQEYSQLKLHIESTLLELEAKANRFKKRSEQEANSLTFGSTIVFQTNEWNIATYDQMTMINLGNYEFVEGSEIACFANINNVEELDVVFNFVTQDSSKSFKALPCNLYDNLTYKIPGEYTINKYEYKISSSAMVNSYIKFKAELNKENDYKLSGGKNLMSVTSKKTGITKLVKFPDINSGSYHVVEDCFIEFYVIDGNMNQNSRLEYNLNKAPVHCNFSLQDGTISLDSDVKRIYIDAQVGLSVSFLLEHGDVYAECMDAVIVDTENIIYNGNLDIRDIVLREYVNTNKIIYNVQVHINTVESIIDSIESILIKEI